MKNDIVSDLGYKKRVTLLGQLLLAYPTIVGSCSLLIIPLLNSAGRLAIAASTWKCMEVTKLKSRRLKKDKLWQ